jgi:hypothetical protein
MISWSFIIERLKEELGLPFQVLERSDEEIEEYLKKNTVKKFSKFFPTKYRITLETSVSDVQVPNRQSEFYVVDPDDRTILSIIDFIPTFGTKLLTGHPVMGAFSYNAIPEYALAVNAANTTELFSIYNYTHEFMAPNIIRISPIFNGQAVIEYERSIDPELSDIHPELEDDFTELCIAMFFQQIGRIRRRYSNINTPFGDIQLNAEEIFSEGETRYNELMEKFNNGTIPNVIFSRG